LFCFGLSDFIFFCLNCYNSLAIFEENISCNLTAVVGDTGINVEGQIKASVSWCSSAFSPGNNIARRVGITLDVVIKSADLFALIKEFNFPVDWLVSARSSEGLLHARNNESFYDCI